MILFFCYKSKNSPPPLTPTTTPSCRFRDSYSTAVTPVICRESTFSSIPLLHILTINPRILLITTTATTMGTAGMSTFWTRCYHHSRYLLFPTVCPSVVRSARATCQLVKSVTQWLLCMRIWSCRSAKMLVQVLRRRFFQYMPWFRCWMVIMTSLASHGKILHSF